MTARPGALRAVSATRYVTPLREGGSLPGLMEASDLGLYVVKFSGAGQGVKALVAEIVVAGLAAELDLPVPDVVAVDLDPALAVAEPDEEVQDLLRASPGRNLGIDYLPGALDLDAVTAARTPAVVGAFAGRVLWFDALVGNVDRSWRNPNLLLWHTRPYLIDHGACLTFHHDWSALDVERVATRPFDAGEHVLLGARPDLDAADTELAPRVTPAAVDHALDRVPDDWLAPEAGYDSPAALRAVYRDVLLSRVAARDRWLPALRESVRVGGSTRIATDRSGNPSRGRP